VAPGTPARLGDVVRQANALPRLRALILVVFGLVAAGIVALGSFGLMSQLVLVREREFATRLVFGANPVSLGRSVLVGIVRLTIPGVVVGLVFAWAFGATLKAFVFGVNAHSPGVLGFAGALVLTLAVAAAVPGAVRASRVDPRRCVSGD
jgi:hypothetical protein